MISSTGLLWPAHYATTLIVIAYTDVILTYYMTSSLAIVVSKRAAQRPKWAATLTNLGSNSHTEKSHSEETSNILFRRELK